MRTTLLTALLVLALVAVGCGGEADPVVAETGAVASDDTTPGVAEGSEPGAAQRTDTDESAETAGSDPGEATDTTDTADGADDDAGDGAAPATDLAASVANEDAPLAALLGFDGFEDPSFLVEQQRRVDEQIQVCMRAEGFDYIPQDLDPADFAFGRAIAPGLSDEAFAEQYGYGIAATADTMIELTNRSLDDPTNQMLLEMSDAEAEAWQRAMLGSDVDIDRETGEFLDPETGEPIDITAFMMTGDGCATTANREVFSSLQALFLLESEFADLSARFDSDPRVTEITAAWSSCLAEAGFDYAQLGQPPAEFNSRLTALLNPLMARAMAVGGDRPPEPIALTAEQRGEIDELQAEEIAVATADHACLADDIDELDEIQKRYELAFIDDNAEALQAAAG